MSTTPSTPSVTDLDRNFREAGVPLRYRPLECFKRLHGSVPDGKLRESLFDPIIKWYLTKYGDAAQWDGVIARFPVLVRGEVFLALARFIANGEVMVDYRSAIENLPDSIAQSFGPEDFKLIAEKLATANLSFQSLHNLQIDDDLLAADAQGLVRRAVYDLENAAVVLKNNGDTQTSIVLSHEAAEKFLKAALIQSGYAKAPQAFGHNMPAVLKELIKTEPRYSWLRLPIENLQKLSPNMQMRYRYMPRSPEDAVSAFHAALSVCGPIAQMWLFDKARGATKSRFLAGRFYYNGAMESFYCKRVQGKIATLTLFRSSEITGSQMMDLQWNITENALFLEVSDPQQDLELRNKLIAHLRNPGRRASPEELGINIVNGPEGSYITARFKVKTSGPGNSSTM